MLNYLSLESLFELEFFSCQMIGQKVTFYMMKYTGPDECQGYQYRFYELASYELGGDFGTYLDVSAALFTIMERSWATMLKILEAVKIGKKHVHELGGDYFFCCDKFIDSTNAMICSGTQC